ncbi:MAG: nucleotidyltransferase family protein [Bacteroidales bacterium]|nr:nucleotidyltransferase family protein [Bacteroidales bacterium]
MSLFNELLKVSLGTRDQLSRVPALNEWNALLNEASHQSVAAVMSCGIERLPAEQRPSESFWQHWLESRHKAAAGYRHYCSRAKEISGRFLDAGFKCCVLNGVGVSQFYPDPSLRKSGGVNVWVTGPRNEVMEWIYSEGSANHIRWHKVHADLPPDLHSDVLFHPTWLYNPCHNRRLQGFFDRNKASQMEIDESLGFAYPSARFNAVFALAHTFRHFIADGSSLRHVVDYYFILKALKEDERKTVMTQIRRCGLSKFAGAMMWVMKEVCGASDEMLLCKPNKKEGKFYLEEITKAGKRGGGHKSGGSHKSRSRARARMMFWHYMSEVFWMRPRKTWHKWWKFFNR